MTNNQVRELLFMKLIQSFFTYLAPFVGLLSLALVLGFMAQANQVVVLMQGIAMLILLIALMFVPVALVYIYMNIPLDELEKIAFRKLCWKWLGLGIVLMIITVDASADLQLSVILKMALSNNI
jgi:uncharacterized membrane-anchored protein YitT (DUF2179 family)